jgi:hypothetical protein
MRRVTGADGVSFYPVCSDVDLRSICSGLVMLTNTASAAFRAVLSAPRIGGEGGVMATRKNTILQPSTLLYCTESRYHLLFR